MVVRGIVFRFPAEQESFLHRVSTGCQAHPTSNSIGILKSDSHLACRAHAVPLPCCAAKGLECVFPIWFTQCGRVWFKLAMACPCRAHAMLWPRRSSEGHGTARPSRDGLWANCSRSASSSYHAEFHEHCYQKHTNTPHNDPYLRL
jgi:hypothetical protein